MEKTFSKTNLTEKHTEAKLNEAGLLLACIRYHMFNTKQKIDNYKNTNTPYTSKRERERELQLFVPLL